MCARHISRSTEAYVGPSWDLNSRRRCANCERLSNESDKSSRLIISLRALLSIPFVDVPTRRCATNNDYTVSEDLGGFRITSKVPRVPLHE